MLTALFLNGVPLLFNLITQLKGSQYVFSFVISGNHHKSGSIYFSRAPPHINYRIIPHSVLSLQSAPTPWQR
jgi:hypothetical protein